MRLLLAASAFVLIATSAQAEGFRTYPGFVDRNGTVEMVHDKGLMLELHVRCDIRRGKVGAGIMTYSKVERLFCSSRHRCSRDPIRALRDTCGS